VDDSLRDVTRLVVPRVGALVEVGEPVVGFRLLDEHGVELGEVSESCAIFSSGLARGEPSVVRAGVVAVVPLLVGDRCHVGSGGAGEARDFMLGWDRRASRTVHGGPLRRLLGRSI